MGFEVSKDFHSDEFTWSETAQKHARLTIYNTFLLTDLVMNILQLIRNNFGRLDITSGIRDKEIIDTLKAMGYPVSKTTDHSYMDPEVNTYGVGAADFVSAKADAWDVYEWIVNSGLPFGQVIIYPDPDDNPLTNDAFIHIANPKIRVFSPLFSRALGLLARNQDPNRTLVYRKSWPDGEPGKYRTYTGERI